MNIPHVRFKLVLSREWLFLTGVAFTAVTARSLTPESLRRLVNRIAMTNQVGESCEGFGALWPVAMNPFRLGIPLLAWAILHVIIMARAEKGGGLPRVCWNETLFYRSYLWWGIPALELKKILTEIPSCRQVSECLAPTCWKLGQIDVAPS
jgi:hypothetical protein